MPSPNTLARLAEFREKLTVVVAAGTRAVRTSGGAAEGGVVSEGMGYALLLAGVAMASQQRGSAGWSEALHFGEEVFAGWRRMCELSREHCQGDKHISCGGHLKQGASSRGFAACLPSWKFDNALKAQAATGSAADADEDALLGLVLMVGASDAATWPLYDQTLSWTYETCRAFLRYNTLAHPRGDANAPPLRKRVPKLGSCWGGWDCNNPSYTAPAHYRAFRAFMLRHGPPLGLEKEATAAASQWEGLIASSYAMLDEAQCEATGLTPNWWAPAGPARLKGAPGCNASGTAADEFGAEASRGVWRVAVDALWAPSTQSRRYTARVSAHLASLLRSDSDAGFGELGVDPACANVRAIAPDWYWNPFLYGPLASALLVPAPAGEAKRALDLIGGRVAETPITTYYAGAWLALTTLTLNGDLAAACTAVFDDGCPPPPPPPKHSGHHRDHHGRRQSELRRHRNATLAHAPE